MDHKVFKRKSTAKIQIS